MVLRGWEPTFPPPEKTFTLRRSKSEPLPSLKERRDEPLRVTGSECMPGLFQWAAARMAGGLTFRRLCCACSRGPLQVLLDHMKQPLELTAKPGMHRLTAVGGGGLPFLFTDYIRV